MNELAEVHWSVYEKGDALILTWFILLGSRQHIQAEGSAKAGSVDETKKTLEKLEALTLELIKEIATELAEVPVCSDHIYSTQKRNGSMENIL